MDTNKIYAVIIIDSCTDLGMTPEEAGGELVCNRVRCYNNPAQQLNSYAETPCTWSECFTGTKEELDAKVAEMKALCKDPEAFYAKYGDMM